MQRRPLNVLGFLICTGLMGYALYSQYIDGLEPCPLCVLQRVAMIAAGLLFLLAALHNPAGWGARIYGVLVLLACSAGVVVAGRHVWLQSLPPDEVPACGPGLEYMLDAFPLSEALQMVFSGSGECADVSWSFLALSMPTWVLVWFVILGLGGMAVNATGWVRR